jgi:hypothetical protein
MPQKCGISWDEVAWRVENPGPAAWGLPWPALPSAGIRPCGYGQCTGKAVFAAEAAGARACQDAIAGSQFTGQRIDSPALAD